MKASTSKAGFDVNMSDEDVTAELVDVELRDWWFMKGGMSKPGTRRASFNGGGAREDAEGVRAVLVEEFETGVTFE